ncbi:MAG: IreB family regulatory phosphoprotein [Oscillospiraceae bacterium]|nr:IreB family regulatory phosphoprotein [Oscillospiraceae bacterium]
MKTQEQQILNIIINSIEAAGYSPYAQLTGYMDTGNAAYITRQFGARKLARSISPAVIRGYLASHVKTA